MVDVIHSDGYPRMLRPTTHYGSLQSMGDVDFYPSWGEMGQPGCGSGARMGCSHMKAVDYFIWSIGNPGRLEVQTRMTRTPTHMGSRCRVSMETTQLPVEMGYYGDSKQYRKATLPMQYYTHTNPGQPFSNLGESLDDRGRRNAWFRVTGNAILLWD